MLNGPEDEPAEWSAIDWQTIEQDVRRLRQRIFTCLLEPDAVKAASPVLRGAGRSNAPGLPDELTHRQSVRTVYVHPRGEDHV